MHELSIVQNIVTTTSDFCKENNIDSVSFLTLVIGQHTGVIPKYVRMYYDDFTKDTVLEGSDLRIEEVSTEYFCRDCGHVFEPDYKNNPHLIAYKCPECDSNDLECIAGDELIIKEVGYE